MLRYSLDNFFKSKEGKIRLESGFFELSIHGKWVGMYKCGQGLSNATLTFNTKMAKLLVPTVITAMPISAIFKFQAYGVNGIVYSGSYQMEGMYNGVTKEINLKAEKWINQPSGFSTVDLNGILSEDEYKISGKVIGGNCSTFTLKQQILTKRP